MPSVGSASSPLAYWPQSPTHRPATGGPARAFFCQTCRLSCSGPEPWRQHLESARHMKLEADLRGRMGLQPAVPVGASSPAGGSGSAFFCEACQLGCTGPAPWREHTRSAKHLKRVSLQERAVSDGLTSSQPPSRPSSALSVEDVLRSGGSPVAAISSPPPLASAVTENSFYCNFCRLSCSGPEPWRQHVQSAKHLKKKSQAEIVVSVSANGITHDGVSTAAAFNGQTGWSSPSSLVDVTDTCESPAAASDSAPLVTPWAAVGGQLYCDACRIHCSGQEPWKQHVQSAKHLKLTSQPGHVIGPSPAGYRSAAVAADHAPPPPAAPPIPTPASGAGRPFNCDPCGIHYTGEEPWTRHAQGAKHLKLASQHDGGPSAPAQTAAGGASCSSAVLTKPDPDGPRPQSGPISPGGRSEASDGSSSAGPPAVSTAAERSGPPTAASPGLSDGASGWGWALQLPAGSPRTDRVSPQPARHGVAALSGSSDPVSGRSTPVSVSSVDSSQFRCEICQLSCTGQESLQQHLRGEKHRKMTARRLGAHFCFSSTDTPDGPSGRVPTPTRTPTPLVTPARPAEGVPGAAAGGPLSGVCADPVCAPGPGPGAAGVPEELSAMCRSIRLGSYLHDLLDRKDGISQEHTATADVHLRQLHVEGLVAFLEDVPLVRHNQPFSPTRC